MADEKLERALALLERIAIALEALAVPLPEMDDTDHDLVVVDDPVPEEERDESAGLQDPDDID